MIRHLLPWLATVAAAIAAAWAFPVLRVCLRKAERFPEQRPAAPTPRCPFKFVVHVGPHKTGTTSLQSFLVKEADWLMKEFQVFVAASGNGKDGAKIPHTIFHQLGVVLASKHLVNTSFLADTLKRMNAVMGTAHVVLSAEGFSKMNKTEWNYFKTFFGDHAECLSILVAHRRESDRLFSHWNQLNKDKSNPESFTQFALRVLQFDPSGHIKSSQLELLDILTSIVGGRGRVYGVSYEFLRETNTSMAAFLICNVTLGLSDAQERQDADGKEDRGWTSCNAAVEQRSKTKQWLNVSPPMTAIDVVRLAHFLYLGASTKPLCNTTFALKHVSAGVVRVADKMPVSCGTLNGAFKFARGEWFSRTQAQHPFSPTKPTCVVNEASLTKEHWAMIDALLPQGCRLGFDRI